MTGRRMSKLVAHPLADLFPLIEGSEFNDLVADIKTHGQREPIVVYQGKILDGRNRYRACIAAKIDPAIESYTGDNPLAYVLSLNLKRRHLNESQRAMVAAKLAIMRVGRPVENRPIGLITQERAAEILNVSERSIKRAVVVRANATSELIHAADQGQVAVAFAAQLTKRDAAIQRAVVEKVAAGTKPTEALRQVIAKTKRARPLVAPSGKFRVLYADPAWDYGTHEQQPEFGEQRDHYPVMTIEEICALKIGDRLVREIVEDDAVLFMWATAPILEKSFAVISAWGFAYKTQFIWDKQRHVMGHYNSVRHENLLICTRGSCLPDVGVLINSVVSIPRTAEHSAKPKEFRAIIDQLYTWGRRIELFARGATPEGWDIFGFEAEGRNEQANEPTTRKRRKPK